MDRAKATGYPRPSDLAEPQRNGGIDGTFMMDPLRISRAAPVLSGVPSGKFWPLMPQGINWGKQHQKSICVRSGKNKKAVKLPVPIKRRRQLPQITGRAAAQYLGRANVSGGFGAMCLPVETA